MSEEIENTKVTQKNTRTNSKTVKIWNKKNEKKLGQKENPQQRLFTHLLQFISIINYFVD